MQILLGSSSPRRAEILGFFNIVFKQAASEFDEESVPFEGDPAAYAATLATKKGELLALQYTDLPIVTADTVVFLEGILYNKPKDRAQAVSFLQSLSGKEHFVYTAVALYNQGRVTVEIEKTGVTFHKVNSVQINHYLDKITFLDKAGGYAVQQGGSLLIRKIDGCYYNVMGLPVGALSRLLSSIGIDLWERMKIL